ncbi:TonB-dependent receptor plug domain-containing protein [Thalassotalea ganghwensis]
MYKRLTSLIPLFVLSSSVCANNDDLLALSIEDLLEVKVSVSSRYDETLRQAPSSVTVMTRQEFDILGLTTLETLLNYVSGVQYSRAGYQSKISFRGRHANNNDILVLLDGMRLNDPVSASAFIAFQYIDLASIEKVEVIKGPGSAMYGSNAYNGVISLTSRSDGKKLSANVGSFNRIGANLSYHHQGQQGFIGVNAGIFDDQGDDYSPFFDFFGIQESTQDPRSGHYVYLTSGYNEWYVKAGLHHRRSEDFVWQSQGNGINNQDVNSEFYQLGYQGVLFDTLNFNFNLEQTKSEQSAILVVAPEGISQSIWSDDSTVDYIGGNYREVEAKRVTLNTSWQQTEQASMLFGLEYRKEQTDTIDFQGNWQAQANRDSLGFIFLPRREAGYTRGVWWFGSYQPLVPEVSRNIQSAYLQQHYQLNQQWKITLGAHYDDYSDVGNHISMRGAFVYQANQDMTFKALYGEAFRAPSLYELNALIATGFIGNSNLKPETVKTVDLIWQQEYQDIEWSLTYYYSDFAEIIENVLVDDIVRGFSSFQPQNFGSLILSGWELDLKAKLSAAWSFSANASTAERFKRLGSARSMAALALKYQQEAWQASISAIYHSSVVSREATFDNEAISLSSYWLAKMHLVYGWSQDIEVSLSIDNLFDKYYLGYNEAAGTEQGVPARGRQITAQLTWHW